jgi:hypothetical protein
MSQKLVEYFNKQPRLGTLSTVNKAGEVNVAYIGSAVMTDPKSVTMGLGNNRTLKNLQENPNAVYMVMEPGKKLPEWKGVRVYMKMTECHTSGKKLEEKRAEIGQKVGAETANKMIQAAVIFEVTEIRPMVDLGQTWEKSI